MFDYIIYILKNSLVKIFVFNITKNDKGLKAKKVFVE